jgi:hypothetical protein
MRMHVSINCDQSVQQCVEVDNLLWARSRFARCASGINVQVSTHCSVAVTAIWQLVARRAARDDTMHYVQVATRTSRDLHHAFDMSNRVCPGTHGLWFKCPHVANREANPQARRRFEKWYRPRPALQSAEPEDTVLYHVIDHDAHQLQSG